MKKVLIVTPFLIGGAVLYSCGKKSSSKESKKSETSWEYSYEETIHGITCKAENESHSLEEHCKALKDHKANNNCAFTMRKTTFEASCKEFGGFPEQETEGLEVIEEENVDSETGDTDRPSIINTASDNYINESAKIIFISKKSEAEGCEVSFTQNLQLPNRVIYSKLEGPTNSEILRVNDKRYGANYFSYSNSDANVLNEIRRKMQTGSEIKFTNEKDCMKQGGGNADYWVFGDGFHIRFPEVPPSEKYTLIDLELDSTYPELEHQLKFSYAYDDSEYFWNFSYINKVNLNHIEGDTVKFALYNSHARAYVTDWQELSVSEMKKGTISIKDQIELRRIIPQQHRLKVVFHVKTHVVGIQRWVLDYAQVFGTVLPKYIFNLTEPEKNQKRSGTEDEKLWRWNISESAMPNAQ